MKAVLFTAALFASSPVAAQSLKIITPTELRDLCTQGAGGQGNAKYSETYSVCRDKILADPNVFVISGQLLDENMKRILADALKSRLAQRQQ